MIGINVMSNVAHTNYHWLDHPWTPTFCFSLHFGGCFCNPSGRKFTLLSWYRSASHSEKIRTKFLSEFKYKYVLVVTDDQQAQQSTSGIFANAQNVLITGGTIIVSLCCSCVWFRYLFYEQNVLPTNTVQINVPVTQMPNSSPIFTGRQDVLDKLRKIFTHQITNGLMSRNSCLLWGMGGIGKTQICLKFIEEMSHM